MHFSSTFKKLCKEKGVTQKCALAAMGMNRNAVQKWTEGHPSYEAILKMAAYFDVSVDSLMDFGASATVTASNGSIVVNGNNNNSTADASRSEGQLTEMESEMLRIFRMMDMRRKSSAMSHFYEIEDELKGG